MIPILASSLLGELGSLSRSSSLLGNLSGVSGLSGLFDSLSGSSGASAAAGGTGRTAGSGTAQPSISDALHNLLLQQQETGISTDALNLPDTLG